MAGEHSGSAVVEVRDVSKTYRLGKVEVPALEGVSLRVVPGEFVAIAGPSGSGKTTLLNLIGCLDGPTHGEIEIDGEPVARLTAGQDRKSTRLNSSHIQKSRMPSSA